MSSKNYYPQRLTKLVLCMRIKSLRIECGLSYEPTFDLKKQSRAFLVSYHNQLIDTYNIDTRTFEYVR